MTGTPAAARRNGARLLALGVVVLLVVGFGIVAVPVLMMMSTAGLSMSTDDLDSANCLTTASAGGRRLTLTSQQLENAETIVRTGSELQVPTRGLVVAVAAALQESTLRADLDESESDRDSAGLFQQRRPWGSLAERMDPATSAAMFYTGGRTGQPGLLDIEGWRSKSVTAAAQAVQRSAFPNAYAQWEALATSLVRSVVGARPMGCTDAVTASLPTGAVGEMLRVALAQQGDPYQWGATGPDAFDCSGLLVYSWRHAGYNVAVRTADQMYDLSTPVEPGEEEPGDILFGSFDGSHAGEGNAGHMMIVVRPGQAVQAPRAGKVVELTRYEADGVTWRLGRLPGSALERLGGSSTA